MYTLSLHEDLSLQFFLAALKHPYIHLRSLCGSKLCNFDVMCTVWKKIHCTDKHWLGFKVGGKTKLMMVYLILNASELYTVSNQNM